MSVWHLYNVHSREHLRDLSLLKVLVCIEEVDPEDYKHWAVWRSGDSEWSLFHEHPLLKENIELFREDLQSHPDQIKVAAPEVPEEIREIKTERRRYERMQLPLSVLVVCNKKAVRAQIDNASLGGLRIKGQFPKTFKNQSCEVYIKCLDSGKWECLRFPGEAFAKNRQLDLIRFKNPSEETQSVLQIWMERFKKESDNFELRAA